MPTSLARRRPVPAVVALAEVPTVHAKATTAASVVEKAARRMPKPGFVLSREGGCDDNGWVDNGWVDNGWVDRRRHRFWLQLHGADVAPSPRGSRQQPLVSRNGDQRQG